MKRALLVFLVCFSLQSFAVDQSIDESKKELISRVNKEAEQRKLEIDQKSQAAIDEIKSKETCSDLHKFELKPLNGQPPSKTTPCIDSEPINSSTTPEISLASIGLKLILATLGVALILFIFLYSKFHEYKVMSKKDKKQQKTKLDERESQSEIITNPIGRVGRENQGAALKEKNQPSKVINSAAPLLGDDGKNLSPQVWRNNQKSQESPMVHGEWHIFHKSIQGLDHLKKSPQVPCQDSRYLNVDKDAIIAIVCDGVGSHQYSHFGSDIYSKSLNDAALNGLRLAKEKGASLRDEKTWRSMAIWIFKTAYVSYEEQIQIKKKSLPDLSISNAGCTAILMIIFDNFLLCAHVGDGRAGYTINGKEWFSCMNPWKGEYANSSVFIHESRIYQSNFENLSDKDNPYLETRVIDSPVTGFCLMSDGVENGIWETIVPDEKSNINILANKPLSGAINQIIELLRSEFEKSLSRVAKSRSEIPKVYELMEGAQKLFVEILVEGNQNLKLEPDDKTLILGYKR